MRTIARDGHAEIVINRSRFIAHLARRDTEAAARDVAAARRRLHHAARHHATAWILGTDPQTRRSNDDGEPAGTAGAPMLAVLSGADLTNTIAVVTRYFGGTKLGTGGLARAYARAVATALHHTGTVTIHPAHTVTITCPHQHAGRLEADLRGTDHPLTATGYHEHHTAIDITCTDTDQLTAWLAQRHPHATATITAATTITKP